MTKNDYAQLSALDDQVTAAIDTGDIHRYLLTNYRFHFMLYERAEAPILLSLAQSLWLRFGPSLRVVCGRYGTSNLPDRHQEAMAAAMAGDSAALAHAIHEDISQGIDQVRGSLAGQNI
ncbi:MAG: FCD domain-containing protein [Paracoccaceae bacterium]